MQKSRRIAAVFLLLLLLLTLAACESDGRTRAEKGDRGQPQCDVWIEKGHPKFVNEGKDGMILGRVWSRCTGKQPTEHHLEVYLERNFHGRYTHEQAPPLLGGGLEICLQIPGKRAIPCERKSVGCVSGLWRVRYMLTFSGDGGALGPQHGTVEPDDEEMGWKDIKCPGPPGAQRREANGETTTDL